MAIEIKTHKATSRKGKEVAEKNRWKVTVLKNSWLRFKIGSLNVLIIQ